MRTSSERPAALSLKRRVSVAQTGVSTLGTVTTTVNQDVFKLSPGIAVALTDEVRIAADVFHVVSGKNTVSGTTYSVGLVLQR